MARYIPTTDGQSIVDIGDDIPASARVIPLGAAVRLQQHWSREAWIEAASGRRYLANMFLSLANSLSDALTYAEELRGEGGNTRAAA